MTSLVHPKIPGRVIKALIKWEKSTSAQYVRVTPAPLVEIPTNEEEDPKEDPEEDEDPVVRREW